MTAWEVNGQRRAAASFAQAIATAPDEVIVVVERPDGERLQAAGDRSGGFVVSWRDQNGQEHTTKNHQLATTTVQAMFDRFAAHDPSWPGTVAWQTGDVGGPSSASAMSRVALLCLPFIAGGLALGLTHLYVALPWLCSRDGRSVERVIGTGSGGGTSATCVFADGSRARVADVAGWIAYLEPVVVTAIGLVTIVLGLRMVTSFFRDPSRT